MAVDRFRNDGPDQSSHPYERAPDANKPTVLTEPVEYRSEHYDALRKAIGEPDRPGDPIAKADAATERTGWDGIAAADRPPLDKIVLSPERAVHILDGDATGGGHRHGTGKPGKTEFPAAWDDAKVLSTIQDVAQAPDQQPVHQTWNDRWLTRGTQDGVEIVAVVSSDGRVLSGWPLPGGPGVVQNPKEK
jgi:Bacterial EndoU nuclease